MKLRAFLLTCPGREDLLAATLATLAGPGGGLPPRRAPGTLGPVLCHVPSLVQHTGRVSRAGHGYHHARDFDPAFRAPDLP